MGSVGTVSHAELGGPGTVLDGTVAVALAPHHPARHCYCCLGSRGATVAGHHHCYSLLLLLLQLEGSPQGCMLAAG